MKIEEEREKKKKRKRETKLFCPCSPFYHNKDAEMIPTPPWYEAFGNQMTHTQGCEGCSRAGKYNTCINCLYIYIYIYIYILNDKVALEPSNRKKPKQKYKDAPGCKLKKFNLNHFIVLKKLKIQNTLVYHL
jgi:hypothetical protein